MLNRQGNFTDLHGSTSSSISDPTTTFGNVGRPPAQGLVNGVPTYNVMNPAQFSTISLGLQAGLPAPTSSATSNNYLASLPLANSNYDADVKIDYKINSRNSFSLTALGGNVGYGGAPNYGSYTQTPRALCLGNVYQPEDGQRDIVLHHRSLANPVQLDQIRIHPQLG